MNQKKTPSIIARKTLQKLSELRLAPTPDNYKNFYNELSGRPNSSVASGSELILSELTQLFPANTPKQQRYANLLEIAAKENNWKKYQATLVTLIDSISTPPESASASPELVTTATWEKTIPLLLQQLEVNHGALTTAKKRKSLNQVLARFAGKPNQFHDKVLALVNSWTTSAPVSQQPIEVVENKDSTVTHAKDTTCTKPDQLQELLIHILNQVANILPSDHSLKDESITLSKQASLISDESELTLFIDNFKKLENKLTVHCEDSKQLQQGLIRLFNLLLDRTETLHTGDEWLCKQFALLRQMLSGPLDLLMLSQVEQNLNEIIQRQEVIRSSLTETKATLKYMVTSLLDNIEEFSNSTDHYHHKIDSYTEEIIKADDISSLSNVMMGIIEETKQMQVQIMTSRDGFLEARAEVDLAQNKIIQLETELQQMGEQAQEDHLTGILNRRGLDNAFNRESENAAQKNAAMCLALIDIDDFKKLNDVHGHKVGDDALVYLVDAMKKTMRPDDIVARFGGEEFVILLPNTELDEAITIISRIKRDLTKRFFLLMNKRLLITFSAGVAEYKSDETQDSVLIRADSALYQAKNNGKNQVIAALSH